MFSSFSCIYKSIQHRKLAQGSHHDNLPSFYVSGKSTLACALSRELHYRGHLTYVLDGDNLRHGLNRDLSFKAEDRAENIRRVGKFLSSEERRRSTRNSFTIAKSFMQEKWQSFLRMLVSYALLA